MRLALITAAFVAALSLANITLTLRGIDTALSLVLMRTENLPQRIEYAMPTTVTLHHYNSNGQLALSATFTQAAGETDEAFRARVAAEWAALVDQFGG